MSTEKTGLMAIEEKNYKMAEVEPKIYVASLSDYVAGDMYGKYIDLDNHVDGESVLAEIFDFLKELDKKHGGQKREEFIILDFEGFPKNYYHEYMGKEGFDSVIEYWEVAKEFDPVAVQEFIEYGHPLDEFEEAYQGEFDSEEEFAEQLADDTGMEGADYIYVTHTDRRLIAQEEADYRVDDMDDEEVMDYAGEDYDPDTTTEAEIDDVRERVKEEIYDEWFEGLNHPKYFLVDEQGIYSEGDLVNQSFIRVDYEAFARDLFISDYFSAPAPDGGVFVYRRY